MKKIISILLASAVSLTAVCFTGCSKSKTTDEQSTFENKPAAVTSTAAAAPTMKAETTKAPETTTQKPGYLAQDVIDILMSKKFYISGKMRSADGNESNVQMIVDGDNFRMNTSVNGYNMAVIMYNGEPYLANTKLNKILLVNQQAVDDMTAQLNSLGIVTQNMPDYNLDDIMSSVNNTADITSYLNMDNYSEKESTFDSQPCVQSKCASEYGNMYVYSSGKNIIALEFYDTDSTRQLVFYVDSFLDIIPDPVSIDSFTKVLSLVNLFTQQ